MRKHYLEPDPLTGIANDTPEIHRYTLALTENLVENILLGGTTLILFDILFGNKPC